MFDMCGSVISLGQRNKTTERALGVVVGGDRGGGGGQNLKKGVSNIGGSS